MWPRGTAAAVQVVLAAQMCAAGCDTGGGGVLAEDQVAVEQVVVVAPQVVVVPQVLVAQQGVVRRWRRRERQRTTAGNWAAAHGIGSARRWWREARVWTIQHSQLTGRSHL